eukprot:2406938-Alexandrium_andersonii.AAC.1
MGHWHTCARNADSKTTRKIAPGNKESEDRWPEELRRLRASALLEIGWAPRCPDRKHACCDIVLKTCSTGTLTHV